MPCGHRHALFGQGGTRAYAAALPVNPACRRAIRTRVKDLDAFIPGTLKTIPICLGSTSGICNNFWVINGLGDLG